MEIRDKRYKLEKIERKWEQGAKLALVDKIYLTFINEMNTTKQNIQPTQSKGV